MKKLLLLVALTLATSGAFAGQSRQINWNNVAEVRAVFEDAFGVHLTPASDEKDQREMDEAGTAQYGVAVKYLGFSLQHGPVFARQLSKNIAEPVCASLGMKVGTVDEEKQVLICAPKDSKGA